MQTIFYVFLLISLTDTSSINLKPKGLSFAKASLQQNEPPKEQPKSQPKEQPKSVLPKIQPKLPPIVPQPKSKDKDQPKEQPKPQPKEQPKQEPVKPPQPKEQPKQEPVKPKEQPKEPVKPQPKEQPKQEPAKPIPPQDKNIVSPQPFKPSGNPIKAEPQKPEFKPGNPQSVYKTSTGQYRVVNAQSVVVVRNCVTYERYVNFDVRVRVFYGPHCVPHCYNDCFSPFIMGYLFCEFVHPFDRACWIYHHRYELDEARYRELLARDAELSARLELLEREKTQRDMGYCLPGMRENPDLQYSKEFLQAVYNPVFGGQSLPGLVLILVTANLIVISLVIVYGVFAKKNQS